MGSEQEVNVYGRRWSTLHDGYFSDPGIALPYLDTISREIAGEKPDTVADLGGGTGFILAELAKRLAMFPIAYINVDSSGQQLHECSQANIGILKTSAMDISRTALVKDGQVLMFIMRSLLHYFGRAQGRTFLEHLRAQMRPGETMVHQSACFESALDADCANDLYAMMRTIKWYPSEAALQQTLAETRWQVVDSRPAPPLCLKSAELAERYGLSREDTTRIGNDIGSRYNRPAVFVPESAGFTAFLHYRIFTCRAT